VTGLFPEHIHDDMRLRILVWIALLTVVSASPLLAQDQKPSDAPISPEGTQVATEQTPAAAANADELRKAAQNPVASLISVPIQDNFNCNRDFSPIDKRFVVSGWPTNQELCCASEGVLMRVVSNEPTPDF
jgi:hypothetical protein